MRQKNETLGKWILSFALLSGMPSLLAQEEPKEYDADFSFDVIRLQTVMAYSGKKLDDAQVEKVLNEIQKVEDEVNQISVITNQAARSFQEGKGKLGAGAQTAAAQKVKELKTQQQLSSDQAAQYASTILHNTIEGKNVEQAQFLRQAAPQTYKTAMEIEKIVHDPGQQTWSANLFAAAGEAAEKLKQQFSKQEIKQFLEGHISDDHPVVKKSLETILGKRTTELLAHPSTKEYKAAVKRYLNRLKDDITFTNRQVASLNEISNQLANDEKIITQQPQKESRWRSWLGRDGVASRKAQEAITYLAGVQASIAEQAPKAKAAISTISRNVQDWVGTFAPLTKEQWKQLAQEEKEELVASWNKMRQNMRQDHEERIDFYAKEFLKINDILQKRKDKIQKKIAHERQRMHEAHETITDYYADRLLELNQLLKQMEAKAQEKIKVGKKEAQDRLAELKTTLGALKKKAQEIAHNLKHNIPEMYHTAQDYYADRLLELNDFLLQTERQLKSKVAAFGQAAQQKYEGITDVAAQRLLDFNDQLQNTTQIIKSAANDIRQEVTAQYDLVTDYYADNFLELYEALPAWMKRDFQRAQELGWAGSLEKLFEEANRPEGGISGGSPEKMQALLAKRWAQLKEFVNITLGNGDNESFLISLLKGEIGDKILLAQEKAQQEACWERWIRLAVPAAKSLIPLEVREMSRGMSCPTKMQDLKAAFKQLQKQADAQEILLDTFGINCKAPDRGERFCRVHYLLTDRIAQDQAANAGGWRNWAHKIKTALNPSEEQELLKVLEDSYRQRCGAREKKMCMGFKEMFNPTLQERATVNDDRYAHPKVQNTTNGEQNNDSRAFSRETH